MTKQPLTIKELKEFLKQIPDVDPETGDESEVWIGSNNNLSNQCFEIMRLGRSDVILFFNGEFKK